MKTISAKIPKGWMNVGISISNNLIADTNNSNGWNDLVIPLPKGRWQIAKQCGVDNRTLILIDKRNWVRRLFNI